MWAVVLLFYIGPPLLVIWLSRIKGKGDTVTLDTSRISLVERWKKWFWIVLIASLCMKAGVSAGLSTLTERGVDVENNIGVSVLLLLLWAANVALIIRFAFLSFYAAPILRRVRWGWIASSVLSGFHLYAAIAFGICGWKAISAATKPAVIVKSTL